MDERDLYILELLRRNARTPKTTISHKLGVTEAAVRKRIRRLETKGIIVGYRAVINYRKIDMTYSFTGIDVEPENLINIIKGLIEMEEIASLYLTSGDHDLLAEIVCRNLSELEEIHRRIMKYRGVKRICPSIVTDIIRI